MSNSKQTMTVTRMFTGADQKTHLEDIAVELNDAGPIGFLSDRQVVNGLIFRYTDGDYDYDWHNAPQRQYIVILDGELEVTIGDGSRRVFGPGDIVLAEDTEGQGHISRSVNKKPRKSLFITID